MQGWDAIGFCVLSDAAAWMHGDDAILLGCDAQPGCGDRRHCVTATRRDVGVVLVVMAVAAPVVEAPPVVEAHHPTQSTVHGQNHL
jgi:hypothetical protein